MARSVEDRSIPLPILPSESTRRVSAALLICGVALYLAAVLFWFRTDHKPLREFALPLGGIAVLGFFLTRPQWYRPLADRLDRDRYPSARRRRTNALRIWIVASAYLTLTALRQHRDFSMRVQDEMMYLLQVRMLAAGHLYLPAHPMADFFQTFYIFTKPVYSSMYFPGAAIFFVPAVWLHLPMSVISLAISGAVVAMTYRVVAELTDGVWGGLAALLVIAVPTFRTLSLQVLSYLPMALLGLLLIWAYLRFRKEKCLRWAALIGALAGWAAITRPLDAICFALPIGVAMLMDLSGMGRSSAYSSDINQQRRGTQSALLTILLASACATPFLSLQLFLNHAVTGHWLQTPVQKYEELYWPGVAFGLHPHVLPGEHSLATPLPQFKDDYEHFVRPFFTGKAKTPPRPFAQTLQWTLPQTVLIILIPIGLLGWRGRRWLLGITFALFPLMYVTWIMFLPSYAAVVAPLTAFAVVLGASQLVERFPGHRKALSTWLAASIFYLALISLPEFGTKDKTSYSEVMQTFNTLAKSIKQPAVVFFRYPNDDPMAWKHEQTYNIDAASIDDQLIVRAQDLGARNIELIRYYEAQSTRRNFYVFDQKTRTLERGH